MSDLVIPIVGVSGAGKDTIAAILLRKHPDRYRKFVSTTTRPPRPGEVDGVDYHFIDDATYARWLDEGKFLLSVDFAGARYGTLHSEISGHGKTLLMLVVESVALEMKERANGKILVIDVDEDTVAARMRARGDSEEQIAARIAADAPRRERMREIADAVVVNDDLDTAVAEVEAAIASFDHSLGL
jgi:guanylate kinase